MSPRHCIDANGTACIMPSEALAVSWHAAGIPSRMSCLRRFMHFTLAQSTAAVIIEHASHTTRLPDANQQSRRWTVPLAVIPPFAPESHNIAEALYKPAGLNGEPAARTIPAAALCLPQAIRHRVDRTPTARGQRCAKADMLVATLRHRAAGRPGRRRLAHPLLPPRCFLECRRHAEAVELGACGRLIFYRNRARMVWWVIASRSRIARQDGSFPPDRLPRTCHADFYSYSQLDATLTTVFFGSNASDTGYW